LLSQPLPTSNISVVSLAKGITSCSEETGGGQMLPQYRICRRVVMLISCWCILIVVGHIYNNYDDHIVIRNCMVHAFIVTDTSFHRSSSSSLLQLQHGYDNLISRRMKNRQHYNSIVKVRMFDWTSRTIQSNSKVRILLQRQSQLQMCICINCARVINCTAYYFVETKHEQPHITTDPTFTPRNGSPTIHVNVRTNRLDGNSSFRTHNEEIKDSMTKPTLHYDNKDSKVLGIDDDNENIELDGETTYSSITPITTYEYDVVACEDYVQDMNCWIRNMPEEIKRANPTFVPT
jgi:Hypothetical chloroplast protein Ycf34